MFCSLWPEKELERDILLLAEKGWEANAQNHSPRVDTTSSSKGLERIKGKCLCLSLEPQVLLGEKSRICAYLLCLLCALIVAKGAFLNLLIPQAQAHVCLMLPKGENCHSWTGSVKYWAKREHKFFKTHSLQASIKFTDVLDELL